MKEMEQEKTQYRRLVVFLYDLLLMGATVGIWAFIWFNYYSKTISRVFWFKGNALIILIYFIIIFIMTHVLGGYKVGYHRNWELFFSGSLALLITNTISYLQIVLLSAQLVAIVPLVIATLVGMAFTWIWAFVGQRAYQKIFPPYRILMVYSGKLFAQNLLTKVMSRDDKYQICQSVSIEEGLEKVKERISEYNTVLFSDLKSTDRNILLKYCYERGKRVYITPKLTDILLRNSTEIELFDSPIFVVEENKFTIEQRMFKRVIDIVFSFIIGIATLPLWLLIALAIKLEDKGNILYRQERLTRDGEIFNIFKFRSMVMNADKIDGPRLASENDNRITKVGKVIRKFRIDELPQMWNIFIGEMSLVGPRPEHPVIAAEYEKDIPEFKYRLKVKAGLTGYAQVIGKYNTTPYDKLKLDLMYISGYSMIMDLKIIFMTIKIIFKWDSTEGIKEGQKNSKLK